MCNHKSFISNPSLTLGITGGVGMNVSQQAPPGIQLKAVKMDQRSGTDETSESESEWP